MRHVPEDTVVAISEGVVVSSSCKHVLPVVLDESRIPEGSSSTLARVHRSESRDNMITLSVLHKPAGLWFNNGIRYPSSTVTIALASPRARTKETGDAARTIVENETATRRQCSWKASVVAEKLANPFNSRVQGSLDDRPSQDRDPHGYTRHIKMLTSPTTTRCLIHHPTGHPWDDKLQSGETATISPT